MDRTMDERRRRALVWLGGAGALILDGRASAQGKAPLPACVVTPQQTEGPYFVDNRLQRADIRAEPGGAARPGVPLALSLRVMNVSANACAPLAGAMVDIWHCDAQGAYSGVDGGRTAFLRGYQVSDAEGRVRFMTIYPGWYPGRAVHIHFKVRGSASPGAAAGRGFEFTSQWYFDEALNERVLAAGAYVRSGARVRNERDGSFRSGGERLMLSAAQSGQGYAATFDIGVRTA